MYHFLHLHEMNTSSLQSKRQTKGKKRELSLLKTLGRRRPSHGNRCLKQNQPHGFVSNRVQHPKTWSTAEKACSVLKWLCAGHFPYFQWSPQDFPSFFPNQMQKSLCFRREKKNCAGRHWRPLPRAVFSGAKAWSEHVRAATTRPGFWK